MKKALFLAALASMMLLLPALLYGQTGCCMRGTAGYGLKGMDLDESQRAELEKLMLDHRIEMVELEAEQRKLHLMLMRKLGEDQPARRELKRLIGEIGAVEEKIQTKRVDHLLATRKILKDGQWERFMGHGSKGWQCGGMSDCCCCCAPRQGGMRGCCGMGRGGRCCGMGELKGMGGKHTCMDRCLMDVHRRGNMTKEEKGCKFMKRIIIEEEPEE